MSTYSDLRGLKIKYLSSDTSGDRITEGELFYNSTTGALKGYLGLAAFHAGGNVLTTRTQVAGSTGATQSANFIVGGEIPSDSSLSNECEEYNGTGYSIGGDLSTARRKFAGSGTLTAGLVFGGAEQPNSVETETYDGSSFSEVNNMNTARAQHGGVGTQTAALACGGYDTARTGKTEEYDGTNWSEQNDMSLARSQLNSTVGTQTAAVVMGGNTTPGVSGYSAFAEEYDGTSWTTSSSTLPIGKNGAFGFGTLTAAVITGGEIAGGSKSTTTQMYDGTSFSSSPAAPASGRMSGTASGTSALGIIQAGSPGAATEEFTISLSATTAGAFSSGTNNPQTATFGGYAGTQTAAVMMGGQPNPTVKTIEYNGSAFSDGGNLPSLAHYNSAGFGIQTAAAICGGITHPGGPTGYGPLKTTLEYDGSSWSEGGALNIEKYLHGAAGTQTAGLAFAGHVTPSVPAIQNTSEEYNGSSWTSGGNMNTARRNVAGTGTQTAALACAGYSPGSSPDFPLANESYNGSSWTSNPNQNFTRSNAVASGPYSSAISIAGSSPAPAAQDQTLDQWNGSIWSTGPAMATRRYQPGHGGGGMNTSLLISGGHTGSAYSNATEEFTPESTATQAIKTVDFD